MEEIIERRRQERLETAEQLKLFQALLKDVQGEQQRAQDLDLTPAGFAIYGLLEKARPPTVAETRATYDGASRDLASLLDEAVQPFTELVDWWQKDDVQREMRKRIKRQLRATGMETAQIEKLAGNIVDVAKVRQGR